MESKIFFVYLEPAAFFTDDRWTLMNSAERGLYWTICLHLYTNGGKWKITTKELKSLANWPGDDSGFETSLKNVSKSFKIYRKSSGNKSISFQHTRVSKELEKAQAARNQRVNAANSRWKNNNSEDAAALRPQCDRNANGKRMENEEKQNGKESNSNGLSTEYLARHDDLAKLLNPKTKSDTTTLRKIIRYIFQTNKDSGPVWQRVELIAKQSAKAVNPMAYFCHSIKREYGDFKNAYSNQA